MYTQRNDWPSVQWMLQHFSSWCSVCYWTYHASWPGCPFCNGWLDVEDMQHE